MEANKLEQMTTSQLVEYLGSLPSTTGTERELLVRLVLALDEIDALNKELLTMRAAQAKADLEAGNADA